MYRQRFLYNYNVILARKDILRDYCEWLFPILKRVEELSVPKGSERADRYIGYMGETLETLYFMKNAEILKIAHTGCRMLVIIGTTAIYQKDISDTLKELGFCHVIAYPDF